MGFAFACQEEADERKQIQVRKIRKRAGGNAPSKNDVEVISIHKGNERLVLKEWKLDLLAKDAFDGFDSTYRFSGKQGFDFEVGMRGVDRRE